ncbi:hypothetical protein BD779DRAFT_1682938 [Infundibulicybe gibba]|nr:hypothetical protein BD779DRAFT_1682938 [Infundibulicybe gibba]
MSTSGELPGPGDQANESSSSGHPPIEGLGLPDILKNPHALDMFNRLINSSTFNQNQSMEISSLRAELQAVNAELKLLRSRPPLEASTSSGTRHSSIMLNDSASQIYSPNAPGITPPTMLASSVENQPSIRPKGYPEQILWILKDCQKSKGLTSQGNKWRPKMRLCVRNLDGSGISSGQWNAIRAKARMIVNRDLHTLPPSPLARPDKSRKKKYYKTYYTKEWFAAVVALEKGEPIVGYCAAHWKAEHLLSRALSGHYQGARQKKGRKKRKFSETSDEESSNDDETEPSSSRNPNARSQSTRQKKTSSERPGRNQGAHHRKGKKKKSSETSDEESSDDEKTSSEDDSSSDSSSSKEPPTKKRRRNHQPSTPRKKPPPHAHRRRPLTSQDKRPRKPVSSLHDQLSQLSTSKRTPSNLAPSEALAPKEPPKERITPQTPLPSSSSVQQADELPAQGSTGADGSSAPGPVDVDVDFIQVSPDASSLKPCRCAPGEILRMFPRFPLVSELLDAMSLRPDFEVSQSSDDLVALLTRIENADPNSAEYSEDDTNTGWGHHQFTAGGLTCGSALLSWRSVGDTKIACRLIAAALKTCKVARHICLNRNIEVTSFLSDAYLQNVIERLWEVWTAAGGPQAKPKGKAKVDQPQTRQGTRASRSIKAAATKKPPPTSADAPSPSVAQPSRAQSKTSSSQEPSASGAEADPDPDADADANAEDEVEDILELRTLLMMLPLDTSTDELKSWISDKNINVLAKLKTKDDYVNAILSARIQARSY